MTTIIIIDFLAHVRCCDDRYDVLDIAITLEDGGGYGRYGYYGLRGTVST